MTTRISKLFGMDVYTTDAEYKGKVFDLVINLEKGRIETITTEPLKVKSKQEAKKIISEKSIPYRNVKAAKDILLVGRGSGTPEPEEEAEKPTYLSRYHRRRQ
ncbi:PRC-barrel domain-containing protein [Candidatus Micrarchaeota archaeon]|nr:PRC-barrel domain-containing protein [Candidatus Micrarchaeota archaeon]MBU1930820.1 PRC-barrel domain-containing protein [Candidatus Micrarchaeota archaeon]